jgi:SAM-dependent methyltransferase
MKTEWTDSTVSERFDSYDDWLEGRLGYGPLIRDLMARTGPKPQVLDYGCGGGKVVRRLIDAGAGWVAGVDIAPAMVDRARAATSSQRAEFRLIDSADLPFAPETFDAALACYLCINLDSAQEMLAIARAVHGMLKPGGLFYTLDTNPGTTGVRFASFQSGEAGVTYADGDLRPVHLDLPDGDVLELRDRHWTPARYREVLSEAGFELVEMAEPRAGDLPESDRAGLGPAEHASPPFLRVCARKPGGPGRR